MKIFQVDAFTAQAFGGNPAAVCVLDEPKPDRWMQQLAQEMNLSETAFLLPETDLATEADGYRLRWFTPAREVKLCGHATLASAHVLWSEGLWDAEKIQFQTLSGTLIAHRKILATQDWIELDFPASVPKLLDVVPSGLAQALGTAVAQAWQDDALNYLLVEVATSEIVRDLQPNFLALALIPSAGIIVTAKAIAPYDFVSRFFAPNLGIDEDPVTGSAHCVLGPYWRDRLTLAQRPQTEFLAHQDSARGGVIKVRLVSHGAATEADQTPQRVILAGQAVTVLRGELCA